jgi:hypothetical protein
VTKQFNTLQFLHQHQWLSRSTETVAGNIPAITPNAIAKAIKSVITKASVLKLYIGAMYEAEAGKLRGSKNCNRINAVR